MDFQRLTDTVLACGAAKAAVIDQSQIVVSGDFREICESNKCGSYGNCWMCPPHIGPAKELMEKVRSYPLGLLYQTVYEIADSYDIEGMFAAGGRHVQVSQKIQGAVSTLLAGQFLHLTCGGCHLCETCAKRGNQPCRFPEKALPSLEGYCVDVYNTAKGTPLKYNNGQNTVTYFGMLLFSE